MKDLGFEMSQEAQVKPHKETWGKGVPEVCFRETEPSHRLEHRKTGQTCPQSQEHVFSETRSNIPERNLSCFHSNQKPLDFGGREHQDPMKLGGINKLWAVTLNNRKSNTSNNLYCSV